MTGPIVKMGPGHDLMIIMTKRKQGKMGIFGVVRSLTPLLYFGLSYSVLQLRGSSLLGARRGG